MEKEFKIFRSFAEADRADREYYLSLTASQRLDIVIDLMNQWQSDEAAKGFERVYRIAHCHED